MNEEFKLYIKEINRFNNYSERFAIEREYYEEGRE